MASVVQSPSPDSASYDALTTSRPPSSISSVRYEGVLVDEQEAEHRHGLGQGVDPLVHQRHRGDQQLTLLVGDRLVDVPGLREERHHPLGHVRERDPAACGRC